jgi:hypothetical protein
VLAILALPAGAIGYFATANLLRGLALPAAAEGLLLFLVPLFVGGLCMAALLLPTFDRMAKRDLAAHRAEQAAAADAATDHDEPPGGR